MPTKRRTTLRTHELDGAKTNKKMEKIITETLHSLGLENDKRIVEQNDLSAEFRVAKESSGGV